MDDALRLVERLGAVQRDSIVGLAHHPSPDPDRIEEQRPRVWAVDVDTPSGRRSLVVKRCFSMRAFRQEQAVLTGWLPRSRELGGAAVPELHLADKATRTLVMSRVPGLRGQPDTPAMHHAAGRFLAALHRLPITDDDRMPLADALGRRRQGWLSMCEHALTADELRVIDDHLPCTGLFAGAVRVPCHRDFTPNNWLWDGERLSVVDFEHARLDLAGVDLAKLAVGPWLDAPALAAAFFAGYGRSPDDDPSERARLRTAIVLHGLASVAWGLEHDEPCFIDEGRRALALATTWR